MRRKRQGTSKVARRAAIGVMLLFAVIAAPALLPLWQFYRTDPNAEPGTPAQIALGQAVYRQQCAICHGEHLEGVSRSPTSNESGFPQPPPLDATGDAWHHPDRQLYSIVVNRRLVDEVDQTRQSHLLALTEELSDDQVWSVLAYVKSLWPARVRVHQRAHTWFTE